MRPTAVRTKITVLSLFLVVIVACAKGPAASTDSGIRGRALLGPTCPVEHAESPCPDRPFAAEIEVLQGGDLVTTVTSGQDGRFSVSLPPGDYVLQGGPPTAKPVAVTVHAHEFSQVDVLFDSGIR